MQSVKPNKVEFLYDGDFICVSYENTNYVQFFDTQYGVFVRKIENDNRITYF